MPGPQQPGQRFKDQGKLDEAVACYHRALQLKPDYAEAHSNLGNALKDQGKLDEAIACYRRALQLKPDFASAYNNLGVVFLEQGKLDDAAACFAQALRFKPDLADGHVGVAMLELLRGDFATRLAGLRMAVADQAVAASPLSRNRRGTAVPWPGKPSSFMPSKGWATRSSSSVTRRWSNGWRPQ